MELNKEKYLFVPCTMFESHYCYQFLVFTTVLGTNLTKEKLTE